MKSKILILLLVVSVGINIGLILWLALPRPMPKIIEERDIKHGWRRGKLRYRLNLDEGQLKKIEAIQETIFGKMEAVRETLEVKRQELINILKEPQPDNSKIQQLIKEIANLQTEIELGLTKNILAIKKILTAKQQEQFFELFKRRLRNREMPKIKGRTFRPFSSKRAQHRNWQELK